MGTPARPLATSLETALPEVCRGPWPRICCYWSGFSAATVNVLRTAQVLARLHNWRPCSVRPRHVVWPGLFSLWEGRGHHVAEAAFSSLRPAGAAGLLH